MNEIKIGKYKHFKGNLYEVIDTALDSETLEEIVIYKALYESSKFKFGQLFVRSKNIFLDNIERENYKGPRFTYIEE